MTNRMRRIRTIAPVAVAIAFVLALSAFFLPMFGGEKAPGEGGGVFLGEDKIITVQYRDWDSAHMLGEKFTINFVIQYRDDKIVPDMESLQSASFDPFELTRARISYRKVEENISEYVYETELVAIRALAGKEYILKPIVMEYTSLATGSKEAADIAPPRPLQVGAYWGDNLENAFFRPHKPQFSTNFGFKRALFAATAVFALASLVMLLILWKKIKAEKQVVAYVGEDAKTKFLRFKGKSWGNMSSDELRSGLRELETVALHLAEDEFGISSPLEFWRVEEDPLKSLTGFLRRSYSHEGPYLKDVEGAVKCLEDIFSALSESKGR